LFFGIIAFLAARNYISLGSFSTARNRNYMVHGELPGRKTPAAVMTEPFRKLSFPPLALPEVTCLAALTLEILIFQMSQVPVFFIS